MYRTHKNKAEHPAYRNYDSVADRVKENYRQNHLNQTYAFVMEQLEHFGKCNSGIKMGIWEAALKLDEVIDDSDPDLGLPQIVHLLQTAEALRENYPGEEYDWLHLTGFIHDLGKLLAHPKLFNQPQWAGKFTIKDLSCSLFSFPP